jgi:PAS domain S-box-containing protein
LGIVGVSHDITERKIAEQSMRQWQRAFEQSELGISLVDPETHTFQSVNAAFARKRGYSREGMVGRPVASVYPETELAALRAHIREADEKGSLCFETIQRRRDGTCFPVTVDVSTVGDEFGRAVSRTSFVHDVTERNRA